MHLLAECLGGRLMGSEGNEGRREDSALKRSHSTISVLTPSTPLLFAPL